MADSRAPSPEPTQLDRIEARLARIEGQQLLLLQALAEEADPDAPRGDLDGGPAFAERAPDEPL